ncbi:hypothetical protein BKI52_27670 [marine bacterium AO1-C]|nr:hypothetical protein BKI52_27670 [marine bacterium AO1-C]
MPEPLYLEEIPEYIPLVILNAEEGVFEMRGDVLPEYQSYCETILDWLKAYAGNPNTSTIFRFCIYYIGDKGEQLIKDIINILRTLPNIVIEWHVQTKDLMEYGEDLSEELAFPLRYIDAYL